jgi:hypothetical protein
MTVNPVPASALEERLERGELIYYELCPFSLPEGDDRQFLLGQRLGGARHKNISYDPHTGRVSGFRRCAAGQGRRLRMVLAAFAHSATAWLCGQLPRYAALWQPDRVSFRPEEEATRRLRPTARNDLLHIDAFPTRPSHGRRILRLFVNVNPSEPRVWVTSDTFDRLLERFGEAVGLPHGLDSGLGRRLSQGMLRLFQPDLPRPTEYDAFMLRFHDFLKLNDRFQERGRRRFWQFAPGSAWLLFADALSHAALRGRFALEQTYFVPTEALWWPERSPLGLLVRACGQPPLDRAA